MAECLKDIGKSIFTECLWPPIKTHIDYWWCFDNNIQVLTDGIQDLERKIYDINQEIEKSRLRTDILKPGVEEWSKAGTEKLGEARRILQDEINRRNLQDESNRRNLQDDINRRNLQDEINGRILQDGINRRILQDDINRWNLISRYSMGKRAKKAADEIAKHQNDGNKFNAIADPAPPPAMGFTTDRSIMLFESRKRIEEDIIKTLKESSVSMIGICGMGGVGKTTMAERIGKRVMEEKEKLFDEVVMVVVSQPIDMLKIQKELAELLGLPFNVESLRARADKLRKRLMDEKRKIVIFDDVWERFKLEDLGVPSGFERCKLLLTTRSEDVCKKMEVQKIIPIEILTKVEAWFLFKRIAGDRVEDSVLHSVAKNVVAECKGLPLALETVGMALQNKEKSDWDDALLQLKRSNPAALKEVQTDVYNHLKLSYDYLDNDCERFLFLLCCLFPEDYNIPVEELTLYFMGLRIFDDDDDITCIKEARNRIHTLVGNLKSRFLLIGGGGKHHVKMHDVVRDVAIYIGSKVKEPIFIGLKEKNRFLKSLNQISIENSSDINCQWMSLDVSNEPMNVNMGIRFPKLLLLMLLNLNSDTSLDGIGDLNVMSFSNISIGTLPPTLASLQNLRTLYLYECDVEDISVIGELAGLEILYCHHCNRIKELPAEIGRLNRLRLLELKRCLILKRIPFGILSSLVRLEELKMLHSFDRWEVEENGKEKRNASVRELESLPNLTCLEIQTYDSNLAAQETRLSQKLVKYCIAIGPNDYWYEDRDNYEKVIYLNLPSEIGAVGKWIQNLVKNTEYLFLKGEGFNSLNIAECQDLRKLDISNCSTLKKVVRTKDCKSGIVFPMLETLRLKELENLEEIWDGTIILNQNNVSSSLSNLKSVVIRRCSQLRYLLSLSAATTCLLQLEFLEIYNCEAMEQVFRIHDITDDGCIEFPKLKELRLEDLPNLKKVVNTKDCKSGIVFPMLETLRLKGLKNLEEIWDGTINQNYVSSLSNLKSVEIEDCFKLSYLLSVSVATTCLLQLEVLHIYRCEAMEQVFRNDMTDHGCIEFPKLQRLTLNNLPNLIAFCQGFENINFPNLTQIWIQKLPKLGLNSETGTVDTNCFHLLCNPKVEIGVLKTLVVKDKECFNYNNIRNTHFFNNLKRLYINEINGIRSLMSYAIAKNLVSLECLEIKECEKMVEVIESNDDDKEVVDVLKCLFPTLKTLNFRMLPKLRMFWQWNHALELPLLEEVDIYNCRVMETFTLGSLNTPKLKKLRLECLPNLTAFCQGIENIKFPQLTFMWIEELPNLNSLCPLNSETPHDHTNPFHLFCNPKVEIDGLKTLYVWGSFNCNNIRNIWCHQIPINFFNNLQELGIHKINGIRSLMSYSIAKNLVSLRSLEIKDCEELVEVIECNDDDKEVVDLKCSFPTLKTLQFWNLPKLRRFWQWNHAVELPLLEEVRIYYCPVMETFTLESLNTPKLWNLDILFCQT